MRCKIDGVGDLRRARFLELGNFSVCPNYLTTVPAVELLDALTWIRGNLAERVHGVREHAGQDLQSVVSGARLVGPSITPTPDHRSDLLRPVELSNPKITKMIRDAVQPGCPISARGLRQI